MKRRKIINTGAIATATAVTLGSCARTQTAANVQTGQPNVRWRMATSWPKSLGIFSGADILAKRVKEMTNGRFTITPFAAGELVPGLQVMDAVQAGTVECGHTASYYYIGKNLALAFATSVPFGFNAQQQNSWLYHGGGLEAMQKIYSDFNIINFPAGNTGAQMGGWFKREINTVADLQGLKMRIPGIGGQVISRMGVQVQVLPGGEIFLALDRGAIDAAEWVGPYDDEKLGLNKAAQFYYYPGWWEPGPTLEVLVNRSAWDKLPPEYQAIFKTATHEANMNMLTEYDALNGQALARLVAGGTKLVSFSPEIMQAGQKASFEFLEENASKDATFKEVYEQWKGFRKQVFDWNRVNELSYANFAISNS
ncbi:MULTISPECIES: TRAP transporter substrate-binding protein [Cyanophyceae]|uniref:ABC transporter substrate-binding protein n=1 Tax=Nodularia spumigena CENA596 TaxID=1819295 RepID=A0A166JY17_NODSP|nr:MULTISPECIES: TRAP transporter substrate-binding protein [Cyanophyceae]KZL50298.1 ABC transporter substrate-binding protein [Nodularia spumigena CENA596]MDB9303877.1 TRAP transporter substrate-binding protein [Nodularia spumigena CS-591/12]MDB9320121.1 TRAP transporter substrate-binding protein [Nodularia spumigena CS-590/01A]MDB9323672.1 TRAP transporter substrate-binding protein [Nodularia spumigena CS-591/07A]MDB9325513.1 TRAP transporter substrate-binding protein [Nodularia spumigena CS